MEQFAYIPPLEQYAYLPPKEQRPTLFPLPKGYTADPDMPSQPVSHLGQANKRASPDDWERVRPLVAELYVNQNKSLPEVIRIMAHKHNHHGTPKMYKSRIERWGLNVKNNRLSDMYAILHQKQVRDAAGKRSLFKVRGRETKLEEVYRYFKRKGVVDPDFAAKSVSKVPATVETFTPPPSPTPRMHSSSLQRIDHLVVRSVPHSPLPPRVLRLPQQLFFSIKAYFDGSFGNRTFFIDSQGRFINRNDSGPKILDMHDFMDYSITGAALMKNGQSSAAEGRQLLSKACHILLDIIKEQHPRLLNYVLNTLAILSKNGHFEVAELLRKYMGDTARQLLGTHHLWGQILALLGTAQGEDLTSIIREAWHCMADALRTIVGNFNRDSIACYSQYIRVAVEPCDAERLLRALIKDAEGVFEENDTLLFAIGFDYMEYLYGQGRYGEAMLQAKILSKWNTSADVLETLAWCHYQLDQLTEAEAIMRSAIISGSDTFGMANIRPLHHRDYLRKWYREWGRESEAKALDFEISRLIELDDIDFEGLTIGE